MSPSDSLERLRQANPVPAEHQRGDADALFEAIVAAPGDPRAARPFRSTGRARRRFAARLAVGAATLTVGAGVAWAGVSGALGLFATNPQRDGARPGSIWDQEVVGSSVRQAATLDIPQLGRIELWYGEARQGGWCGAVRMPGGSWAGTPGSGADGAVPGCLPTREQVNTGGAVYEITGLDHQEIQARDGRGVAWRIHYGVVTAAEPADRVVDETSGRGGVVHRGRVFLLAVPDARSDRPGTRPGPGVRLVAYGADGEVVAGERRPGR